MIATVTGTKGTIASYDYEATVRVQTSDRPEGFEVASDELPEGGRNGVEYTLQCLDEGRPVDGPLSLEMARIGQQIVDAAILSAAEKRSVMFEEVGS